jgi:hypothetical protein
MFWQYSDDPRDRIAGILGPHGWIAGFYNESLAPSKDAQVSTKDNTPDSNSPLNIVMQLKSRKTGLFYILMRE